MSKLYAMAEFRRKTTPVHFTRPELNRLLGLYSRNVAAGEWRDYAIDQRGDCAVFAVFRRAQESPLYTVTKRTIAGQGHHFVVAAGQRTLHEGATIDEVLSVFTSRLRLASRGPGLTPR